MFGRFKVIRSSARSNSTSKRQRSRRQKNVYRRRPKIWTGKGGFPEFVAFPALPDEIIVIECKANSKFHKSADGNNPAAFAVDGALHYSTFFV